MPLGSQWILQSVRGVVECAVGIPQTRLSVCCRHFSEAAPRPASAMNAWLAQAGRLSHRSAFARQALAFRFASTADESLQDFQKNLDAETLVKALAALNPCFMLSKQKCPFCVRAKSLFEQLEARYEVYDLDELTPDAKPSSW